MRRAKWARANSPGSVLTAWVDVTAIVTTIELTEAADDTTASVAGRCERHQL